VGWNIKALADLVGFGPAAARHRHIAFEDDVRSLGRMCVVWIKHARAVFLDVGMSEACLSQLLFPILRTHADPLLSFILPLSW
jgi:hypothetical protein